MILRRTLSILQKYARSSGFELIYLCSLFQINLRLEVRPDYVLSGHTHARCTSLRKRNLRLQNDASTRPLNEAKGSEDATGVIELTLPTFSWRMRPDPGFAILRISDNSLSAKICKLPNEYFVFFLYLLLLPISLTCCCRCIHLGYVRKEKSR